MRGLVSQGPPYSPSLLERLARDERAGARALHAACLRAQARARAERERTESMLQFEREAVSNGFVRVAGVDEAGRGPLAGPIVAAAVVLSGSVPGLDDSKRLTAGRREELFEALHAGDHAIGLAVIAPDVIDWHGIQSANYMAMVQAASALEPQPDFLLVDGFVIRGCPFPQKKLVKGDRRSASIAAASIVAKVTRDRIMMEIDRRHPGYGFGAHKGYGTREHLDAIAQLGPCPVHRKSFAPLAGAGTTGLLFE
ncbi:MAG: ribonuclease HII [Nitrospiraceae bacterium]|nr:ribonuclease HII [Nitrospiraceae bacterium]